MVMMEEQPTFSDETGCLVLTKLLHPKFTFLHSFGIMNGVEDAEHCVDATLKIVLNAPPKYAWNVQCIEQVIDA